jgi:anti-sigma factor RsiW
MNVDMEVRLMRLLHGELPESQARGLRQRLEKDPELAAAYARLARTWEGLDLPAAAPAPPGFAARVTRRARGGSLPAAGPGAGAPGASRPGEMLISWGLAPTWVRTTAAAALALGVLLGAGLSLRTLADDASPAPPGIFDSYLALLNDSAAPPPANSSGGEARP